jgi:hypothetical protein
MIVSWKLGGRDVAMRSVAEPWGNQRSRPCRLTVRIDAETFVGVERRRGADTRAAVGVDARAVAGGNGAAGRFASTWIDARTAEKGQNQQQGYKNLGHDVLLVERTHEPACWTVPLAEA